jgi:hypothetical protein
VDPRQDDPGAVVHHRRAPAGPRGPSLVPAADGPTPTAAADPTAAVGEGGSGRQSAAVYEPARRVLRVLPLGAGLALIGLGLGFLGLRLRRS